MSIKIDKQYDAPWKVMKAASGGKRVARKRFNETALKECVEPITFNWNAFDYAIIDESQPSIDWGGFKWEFFDPYGGLPAFKGSFSECHIHSADQVTDDACLRPSPLYPWTGGECPVPANVEVAFKYPMMVSTSNWSAPCNISSELVDWLELVGPAADAPWHLMGHFRLTGKVL